MKSMDFLKQVYTVLKPIHHRVSSSDAPKNSSGWSRNDVKLFNQLNIVVNFPATRGSPSDRMLFKGPLHRGEHSLKPLGDGPCAVAARRVSTCRHLGERALRQFMQRRWRGRDVPLQPCGQVDTSERVRGLMMVRLPTKWRVKLGGVGTIRRSKFNEMLIGLITDLCISYMYTAHGWHDNRTWHMIFIKLWNFKIIWTRLWHNNSKI